MQLILSTLYYVKRRFVASAAATIVLRVLNPTHPNIDYVMYMRGLTNMALDDSALQGSFLASIAAIAIRNMRGRRSMTFETGTQRYPNSQYTTDATKRLVF